MQLVVEFYLIITITATTKIRATTIIVIIMPTVTALDTGGDDKGSDVICNVTVLFRKPNMLLTRQVNCDSNASVMSSRNGLVPLVNIVLLWSSHSILSTAMSEVQLRVATDPSGKVDMCPVTLIP